MNEKHLDPIPGTERRHLRLHGDPVLRAKCDPVAPGEDVSAVIAAMRAACDDGQGIGLAASQIGATKRIVLIALPGAERIMVNPRILRTGTHKKRNREGCLSFPNRVFMVDRWTKIWVKYTNEAGKEESVKAKELVARVIQHEMDHLDGITLPMRGTEIKR